MQSDKIDLIHRVEQLEPLVGPDFLMQAFDTPRMIGNVNAEPLALS